VTEPAPSSGTIVVSGTGRVAVQPDVADLRLGVAISRPTVEAARAAAAEAERRARTLAVAEARARAEVLAAAAGIEIGGVTDIVESGAPPTWPQPRMAKLAMAPDAGTPVESGSTEIAVTVTVSFRIA